MKIVILYFVLYNKVSIEGLSSLTVQSILSPWLSQDSHKWIFSKGRNQYLLVHWLVHSALCLSYLYLLCTCRKSWVQLPDRVWQLISEYLSFLYLQYSFDTVEFIQIVQERYCTFLWYLHKYSAIFVVHLFQKGSPGWYFWCSMVENKYKVWWVLAFSIQSAQASGLRVYHSHQTSTCAHDRIGTCPSQCPWMIMTWGYSNQGAPEKLFM